MTSEICGRSCRTGGRFIVRGCVAEGWEGAKGSVRVRCERAGSEEGAGWRLVLGITWLNVETDAGGRGKDDLGVTRKAMVPQTG